MIKKSYNSDKKIREIFRIGLMRHPPVKVSAGLCYGHLDVDLQDHWEKYAVLPTDFHIEKIYTSPLLRCLKVAKVLARRYYLPYHIDERLREFHFGDWEGQSWNDISPALIDEWAKNPWDWQIPGGETGNALFKRSFMVWLEIKEKQQNALIISHGGPLRLIWQIAQNQKVELLGDLPDFGEIEIFEFFKSNKN